MQDPPNSDSWAHWHNGLELDRSWPSSTPGIEVDRTELKKRSKGMVADALDSQPLPSDSSDWDLRPGSDLRPVLDLRPDKAFGHFVWETAFGAYSPVPVTRTDLDGAWTSAEKMTIALSRKVRNLQEQSEEFHESNQGLGQLVYVTAQNYDAAEGILDRRMGTLQKAVHGQRDPGRFRRPSDIDPWHEEDVSSNNAAGVRKFFERSHPQYLLDIGVVLHDFANQMANSATAIEGHSKALAQVWGGEAAELCQQALRMLHGSAKTLAFDAGRTGEVSLSFGEIYSWYKDNCAKAVGDFEIDDLWEWIGGEDNEDDERARQYLREFNQQMGLYYNMIPADAEMLLPQIAYVQYADLYHDYEGKNFDGVQEDEPFIWLFDNPEKRSPDPTLTKESATEILEEQLQDP